MSSKAPTSATSSTRRCRPSRASRTRGRSSRSRRFEARAAVACRSLSDRRPAEYVAYPLQAELALAPDHEQTRGAHDGGADEDIDGGDLAEECVAEQERPEHGGVVEGRHDRGSGVPIALGKEDVREPTKNADRNERRELGK